MSRCCSPLSRFALIPVLAMTALAIVAFSGKSFTVADEPASKVLRHVVLFKFKESSSKEDVSKLIEEFRGLPKKISEIESFEYGTDNSPEGLADGFTHCFLITFKSEKGRDAYLPHAAHQEFVSHVKPHLDKALVVDYWAAK